MSCIAKDIWWHWYFDFSKLSYQAVQPSAWGLTVDYGERIMDYEYDYGYEYYELWRENFLHMWLGLYIAEYLHFSIYIFIHFCSKKDQTLVLFIYFYLSVGLEILKESNPNKLCCATISPHFVQNIPLPPNYGIEIFLFLYTCFSYHYSMT